MTNAWLVRTHDDRVRLKWRDENGILQDRDFNTEAEARAFGGSLLEFEPDMETALVRAGQVKAQNPGMTPEEAMDRAGISITKAR
jgi:hypothetical protein